MWCHKGSNSGPRATKTAHQPPVLPLLLIRLTFRARQLSANKCRVEFPATGPWWEKHSVKRKSLSGLRTLDLRNPWLLSRISLLQPFLFFNWYTDKISTFHFVKCCDTIITVWTPLSLHHNGILWQGVYLWTRDLRLRRQVWSVCGSNQWESRVFHVSEFLTVLHHVLAPLDGSPSHRQIT